MRTREPSNDYSVDPDSTNVNPDAYTLTATLKSNNGGSDLILTLTGLEDDTFRLKIKESDSKRYELVDILNGELTPTE